MAGRKAVMVDTDTWNRLEKYRYDSYARSIGDAVADLLDVTTSHSYYAGIHHKGKYGGLLVCSIGRTDEEALRNLMSRENLLRSDIITFVDYGEQDELADFYFTVPCTKEVYDLFNLLHNYLPLEYPNGELSLDCNIENNATDFDCFVTINDIWGIAELIPHYFAFVDGDIIYVSTSLYDFFNLPMSDYEKLVGKFDSNFELEDNHPTISDAVMSLCEIKKYVGEDPIFSELINDLDNFANSYRGNRRTIYECSEGFYKEAVASGHSVHVHYHDYHYNRELKYVCYNGEIITMEEDDIIRCLNITMEEDDIIRSTNITMDEYDISDKYEYLQKFRRSVIVIKDNVPFVYSVGETVNEALRNVKDMDYSNPEKFDSYSVERCSKELYLAAIQAELFEDNKLINCVRVTDENGTVYYDVVKSEN